MSRRRTFLVVLPELHPETGEALRETVIASGFAVGPSGSLTFAHGSGDDEEDWPWTTAYADGTWDQVFEVNGAPLLATEEEKSTSGEEGPMQGLSG